MSIEMGKLKTSQDMLEQVQRKLMNRQMQERKNGNQKYTKPLMQTITKMLKLQEIN